MRLKKLFTLSAFSISISVLLALFIPAAGAEAMEQGPHNHHTAEASSSSPMLIDSITPDLMLTITSNLAVAQVGQPITYSVKASNNADAEPVQQGDPIKIRIALPAGLLNMTVKGGPDWKLILDPGQNEAVAIYIGVYPVAPGQQLSPITINGTLTAFTTSLVTQATIFTPEDDNLDNNTVTSPEQDILMTPDLELSLTPLNPPYIVGAQGMLQIDVKNTPLGGPVLAGQPIMLTFLPPSSLSNVEAKAGNDWKIAVDPATSEVTATYTGRYPIKPDQALLPIIIRFTPTQEGFDIATATVTTPSDSDSDNNTATFQLQVLPISALPTESVPWPH